MTGTRRIDVMVDIETLGNKTNSTIFQIGAIAFDIRTGKHIDKFNRIADIEENEQQLQVSASTLKWWLKTNKELFEELLNSGGGSSEDIVLEFHTWLVGVQNHYGVDNVYLWGNGILFDNKMLQFHMENLGVHYPIHFRNDRDVRTLLELTSFKTGLSERDIKDAVKDEGLVAHNAYDDVVKQINLAHKCYKVLVEDEPINY